MNTHNRNTDRLVRDWLAERLALRVLAPDDEKLFLSLCLSLSLSLCLCLSWSYSVSVAEKKLLEKSAETTDDDDAWRRPGARENAPGQSGVGGRRRGPAPASPKTKNDWTRFFWSLTTCTPCTTYIVATRRHQPVCLGPVLSGPCSAKRI